MAPLAIVECLDVVEHRAGELETGPPTLTIEQLDLHARPEALHDRVIERVVVGAEKRHEPVPSDSLGEGPRSDLSVVSMDDAAAANLALLDRHVEGVLDKLGVLDRVDRSTHSALAACVHHATTEDFAFVRCSVMSVTQCSSNALRANLRSTRSSLVGVPLIRFTFAGPEVRRLPRCA